MHFKSLDHVNVRTANLDAMIAWYGEVLDMPSGDRPDFGFPGAWLYCNGNPIVHLVSADPVPKVSEMQLEHFAIGATGLPEFIERLKSKDIDYRVGHVKDVGIIQVNVWDPDGNHIHIDFPASEGEGLDL
ncbi:MAG: VOC family protein [Pseudomonadota bacterium]